MSFSSFQLSGSLLHSFRTEGESIREENPSVPTARTTLLLREGHSWWEVCLTSLLLTHLLTARSTTSFCSDLLRWCITTEETSEGKESSVILLLDCLGLV